MMKQFYSFSLHKGYAVFIGLSMIEVSRNVCDCAVHGDSESYVINTMSIRFYENTMNVNPAILYA